MPYQGLLVGALPSLAIRGTCFTARSKGKDADLGELPSEALTAIRAAGLEGRRSSPTSPRPS